MFNQNPYAFMFHHFHDSNLHKKGQGSISSEKFLKIINFARKNFNLLNADEFMNKSIDNKLEKNDTVLTLDDALKSQIDIALPIIESEGIKAFFFVYKSAFGESPDPLEFYRDFRNTFYKDVRDFYRDFYIEMQQLFPLNHETYLKNYPSDYLKDFAYYTKDDRKFRFARDKVLSTKNYFTIMESMLFKKKYNKLNEKKRLLMNISDLKKLENSNQIIGLHSCSHPTLMDKLNPSQQYYEYKENKDFLENNLNQKINCMSHPCGRYNQSTLEILKELKIEIGFRSSIIPNKIKTNLEIPRDDHTNIINKFYL